MKRFVKAFIIIMVVLALTYLGVRVTLNSADEGGLTPVHFAAMEGDAEKVSLMLAWGGNVAAPTPEGVTPLHLAGSPDVVTVLTHRGAKLDARTAAGDTPLHSVCLNQRPDVVQRMTKLGADVNALNDTKETPLHMAAVEGDTRTAALLLEHGANPRLRDAHGLTPRQVAQRKNHLALAQALAKAENTAVK